MQTENTTPTIATEGFVILDGALMPIAKFAASIGAQTQYGYLDLDGYTQPLPSWIVSAGADQRNYWFAAVLTDDGWRVRAGCRDFTVTQALRHWGSDGQSDRADCLALVEKLVAEIAIRDGISAAVAA